MLHFVLCDDNVQVLDRLEKSLQLIFTKDSIDAEVVYKSKTPEEVIDYMNNNTTDVLILDINLKSNISGCDVANIIRKKNKNLYLIFLTGHLEYSLLAYKYKTFDYLAKPITDERLEETVLRLVEDTMDSNTHFIRLNNNIILKQDEINYIKKDGMKLVFCTSSKAYEIYSSFSKIKSCLPDNFVRCHKSYIININNITNLDGNNIVMFDHNSICYIGAKYKNNFLEVIKNGNSTTHLEYSNK